MKYYLIAGEQSGDMHGGNLITALKTHDQEARFRGFGGDDMAAAGMDIVTHHRDMDFAGLLGLLAHLRTIYIKIKQCKNDILSYQPNTVILIDYGGFNLRIAKFCYNKGIKVFYYIPPKVWAWHQSRVHQLKAYVDCLFCILPFEKKFYENFNMKVEYVGNPVLDAVAKFRPDAQFLENHMLAKDKHIIALLPGSRKNELKQMVPLFTQIISLYPQYQFVVAAVSSMPDELYAPFSAYANAVLVEGATYDLLSHAHAAVVTSGTATLETGLLGVPQVVLYKATFLEYLLVTSFVNVKYISLINLIADRALIKEYLQGDATVVTLNKELKALIENRPYREKIIAGYKQINHYLDVGSASENTAVRMIENLRAKK